MSAFVCSDLHLSSIAIAVSNAAQAVADKLKEINIKSVNYRYKENSPIEPCIIEFQGIYSLSIHDIAKLIQCWSYQSGEDNSIDFQVYSAMLENWVSRVGANSERSNLWAI